MIFVPRWRWIFPVILSVALAGCFPSGDGKQDEQKETHFQSGKVRLLAMDYKGAAEAFEKSLEANPRSSSAHYELGLLYADKLNEGVNVQAERDRNYAIAIYHLEKYLQLSEKPTSADHMVRQQIRACKLELLKTESFTLLSSTVQTDLERLNSTNATLRTQVDQLKLQLVQQAYAYSNRLAALQAQSVAQLAPTSAPAPPSMARTGQAPVSSPPAGSRPPLGGPDRPAPAAVKVAPTNSPGKGAAPAKAREPSSTQRSQSMTLSRSHTVRAGETPASIARKYGVPLGTLMAANPGLDPRRMKVGQTVNLPGLKN